jgi:hypothetical protein
LAESAERGVENASVRPFFLQTGGSIYLFSEPVPDNGTLFQIQIFGYFRDDDFQRLLSSTTLTSTFNAYLFVVVFRPEAGTGSYRLVHGPQEDRHLLQPDNLNVEWPVQRGDLVGVIIPSSCINETSLDGRLRILCPSRVDLRTDPWDCSSAFYSPFDTDLGLNSEDLKNIPASRFEEVQVQLSMEVSISPIDGMSPHSQLLQLSCPSPCKGGETEVKSYWLNTPT